MAKKQLRPDRWYLVDGRVFSKYRNLKKYIAGTVGIPVEDLLDASLAELRQYQDIRRIKVKVNRKGVPLAVVGDTISLGELDQLIPMDLDI